MVELKIYKAVTHNLNARHQFIHERCVKFRRVGLYSKDIIQETNGQTDRQLQRVLPICVLYITSLFGVSFLVSKHSAIRDPGGQHPASPTPSSSVWCCLCASKQTLLAPYGLVWVADIPMQSINIRLESRYNCVKQKPLVWMFSFLIHSVRVRSRASPDDYCTAGTSRTLSKSFTHNLSPPSSDA